MDNQQSPAAYNPTNLYDPSTPIGLILLDDIGKDDVRALQDGRTFQERVGLFVIQLLIFALIGLGFILFG
jgi:hypothetical protein